MIFNSAMEPLATWKYAERYLGVGTRSYSKFSADLDISQACHPQLGLPSFAVPTFVVPPDLGRYHKSVESQLNALYCVDDAFLLPVHPDTLTVAELPGRKELLSCSPGPLIDVVPSANARTVFVERIDGQPVEPHFLKLHYPRRLSRFERRLRRPVIDLQLWVTGELSRIGAPFLPEVGGGWIVFHPREEWGFILRETRPLGHRSARFIVPLFALYGQDFHTPEDPTLLEQLITLAGESTGEQPEEFVGKRIIEPMVRLWLDIVRQTGCAVEPHGQNTLFSFTADVSESQVVYRDCAVYTDPAIRVGLGLDSELPEINVISYDVMQPAEQVFSLVYDSFMGHHALSYVARLVEQRFGVRPTVLHEMARAEFRRRGGGQISFPETVYYYDGQLYPGGKWNLADTAQVPHWR